MGRPQWDNGKFNAQVMEAVAIAMYDLLHPMPIETMTYQDCVRRQSGEEALELFRSDHKFHYVVSGLTGRITVAAMEQSEIFAKEVSDYIRGY